MKILNLIIKQQWFDEIIAGRKTKEYREVKPTTIKKLLVLDDDGFEAEDEETGMSIPIQYDALKLCVGYRPDRDWAIVEVKDTYMEVFVDENNEIIWYRHNDQDWLAQQVVYELGKVIEKHVKEK